MARVDRNFMAGSCGWLAANLPRPAAFLTSKPHGRPRPIVIATAAPPNFGLANRGEWRQNAG
jgi:hypothetical protein